MKLQILIASILLINAFAATIDTTLKCGGATDSSYTRGDKAIICIQLKGLSKKIPFQIEVDKYTGLDLKGVYTAAKGLPTFDTQVKTTNGFQLVVQGYKDTIQTDPLVFIRQDAQTGTTATVPYIFPVFSAVINISKGVITSIEWDNGCWNGSDPSICKSQTVNSVDSNGKAYTYNESNNYVTDCSKNSTDGSCDPKIYISWMGTDADGNYMTSAGLRMSRFQSYSVGEFYQSSKSAFSGITF